MTTTPTVTPKFVTTERCRTQHRVTRIIQVVTVVLFGGFIALATWSISSGKTATDMSTAVEGRFNTHEARQEERDVRIEASLSRVEGELSSQRKMIEDLWKSNRGP